jgi:flagellar basal body rod protein FlgB
MEKETLALADAQYQYSSMIDYMNAQYKMIRTAIGK